MVKVCNQSHLEEINWLIRHPEVYPTCFDDGCGPAEEFTIENLLDSHGVYVLSGGGIGSNKISSVFIFRAWNFIAYEIHIAVLPGFRGKIAMSQAWLAIDWIFVHTPATKIIALFPKSNIRAYALAVRGGFVQEGLIRNSFRRNGVLLDQLIMGVTKEVFYASRSDNSSRSSNRRSYNCR